MDSLGVQGLHLSRGRQLGIYVTPQSLGMSCFSATMSSRSSGLNLKQGLSHMLLILQFGEDRHGDLANVNPGHCALGLPKGICIPV